jgi:Xaa-Pro aminopeptidase
MNMSEPLPELSVYAERRARLIRGARGLAASAVIVVPTAPERIRNRDAHYSYRFDSHFHYLTGFTEPEAVVVLVAGDAPRTLLFCRERNAEREVWEGFRFGPELARERFGFDEAHPVTSLDEKLVDLLGDREALLYPVGASPEWDARAMKWLNAVREKARAGVAAPDRVQDVRALIDEMRVRKDAHEIATMRRAATISAAAHRRAMSATRPGRREYEIEAELVYEFRRRGSQHPAYTPIVAGGANACVLHYVFNDAPLNDGELLLIDAGCELDGYASDVTRTFPINGRFSAAQRDVYEIVLAAQRAALEKTHPGAAWNEGHDAAVRVLVQGMLDLKLLSGSLDEALAKESFRRFYMHRTGHWLGLDVHDAGDYRREGKWRPLEPGMVLTVEPGLYIRAADDVPEALHNIGIRIEDDVLVTQTGNEIITHETPKEIGEIEALMREAASV